MNAFDGDKIMEEIKTGQTKMKPKAFFGLLSFAEIAGIILCIILGVIATGMLAAAIESRKIPELVTMDSYGILESIKRFPVMYLLLAAAFMFISMLLLAKFKPFYKNNRFIFLLVLSLLVIASGILFSKYNLVEAIENSRYGKYLLFFHIEDDVDVYIGRVIKVAGKKQDSYKLKVGPKIYDLDIFGLRPDEVIKLDESTCVKMSGSLNLKTQVITPEYFVPSKKCVL